MTILNTLGDFFLTEWIWSVTLGIHHALFAFLYMVVLLKFIARMRLVSSIIMSLLANLFSFGMFSGIVVGGLIMGLNYEFSSEQTVPTFATNTFFVALYLGLIYAVLQALLFTLVNMRYPLKLKTVLLMSLIANALAAWTVYGLLPLYV